MWFKKYLDVIDNTVTFFKEYFMTLQVSGVLW